jgi:signal transduction histidine kinase
MTEKHHVIHSRVATFSSDAQLLAELGERLIASPTVALAELLKNSYDADAKIAYLWLSDGGKPSINLKDDGRGMTEREFLDYWMIIGSTSKLHQERSKIFKRAITGSKGVGRFAIRLLGRRLKLVTVAFDPESKEYQQLEAKFDWNQISAGTDLGDMKIPYVVKGGFSKKDEGTHLIISELQEEWQPAGLETVTRDILDIVDPPFPPPVSDKVPTSGEKDPGFTLFFGEPGQASRLKGAVGELFDRWMARMVITVRKRKVKYECTHKEGVKRNWSVDLKENFVGNVHADIRYYPRRPGMFTQMETMDGRQVQSYLKLKGGVKIVDRGFRLPPYGDYNDDWLRLSHSKALNERVWASSITKILYPESERDTEESRDPLLKVPTNHQLLGAVWLESYRPGLADSPDIRNKKLQPAMDRSGFVDNEAFSQLFELVRTGVELIAVVDVDAELKRKVQEAREETKETKKLIEQAIKNVEARGEIPAEAKTAIIQSYKSIESQLSRSEAVKDEARHSVEIMSLMGVLAGFMTHETTVMLRSVSDFLNELRALPPQLRTSGFDKALTVTEQAYNQIRGYIGYAKLFVGKARDKTVERFKVKAQVDLVLQQFQSFMDERGIKCENLVPERLISPAVNVSVYSGIFLNLLTNAIKAVLKFRVGSKERQIRIEAMNTPDGHVLRVSDKGVGIPSELRDLVFEPLFTTTAEDGPLGTGMGLGLYNTHKVVEACGGTIKIVEPPEGFITCFEVHFKEGGVRK